MTEKRKATRGQYHRGQRLEPGQVLVARPSKFGNPYKIMRSPVGDALVIIQDGNLVRDNGSVCYYDLEQTRRRAVEMYRRWFEEKVASDPAFKLALRYLLGRQLFCYCAPDLPCHADVLCEYLNRDDVDWWTLGGVKKND